MPYYGEENQNFQWWDGKTWVNRAKPEDHAGKLEEFFKVSSYIKALDEKNAHPDGCFKCPACRLPHFIPTNYDLLCDGCVYVQSHQAPESTKKEIEAWRAISKEWWLGDRSKVPKDIRDVIIQRMEFRELWDAEMKEAMMNKRYRKPRLAVALDCGYNFLLK